MVPMTALKRTPRVGANQGWRPGALKVRKLGQEEPAAARAPIFNLDEPDVYNAVVANVAAYGYIAAASLFYGKSSYKIIDRLLLGSSAVGLGIASYFSFKMLDQGPQERWNPMRGVFGALFGALNGLGAVGTGVASVSPGLGKKARRQELLTSAVQAIAS